jgi:hypothetical protein
MAKRRVHAQRIALVCSSEGQRGGEMTIAAVITTLPVTFWAAIFWVTLR